LIESTIGLENIPVIHVNDSKIALGGKVDRHENLGEGKIGEEAFRRILQHPRLSSAANTGLVGRAFLLETPIENPGDDRKNVAALWEYAGLASIAPEAEKGYSMLTSAMKKMRKTIAKDAARLTPTEKKIKAKAEVEAKKNPRRSVVAKKSVKGKK
jgi:hypothetical protein